MCEAKAHSDSNAAFSLPGDSGALVHNENNELVGMLLGSNTGRDKMAPTSIFTSWTAVAQSFNENDPKMLTVSKTMGGEEGSKVQMSLHPAMDKAHSRGRISGAFHKFFQL